MPDEVDIPTDKLGEQINEVREKAEKDPRASWINQLAVTTALLAVLAAVSALLSGQAADDALLKANEAVYDEAIAVDAWTEFQADSIKAVQESGLAAVLMQMHAPPATVAVHTAEAARRKANQAKDQATAQHAEQQRDLSRAEGDEQSQRRQRFAVAVTLFQVGIGLAALAALLRRRALWYCSLVAAVIGLVLLGSGFLPATMPPPGAVTPAPPLMGAAAN